MPVSLHWLLFLLSSLLVYLFTKYTVVFHTLDTCLQWINDITEDHETRLYDYIVVGAGSAGAILARRLADDGRRVLLLEAGGRPPPLVDIPLLSPVLQRTPYDWQYRTEPQSHACRALYRNESRWPMGKILGGTSRLNYMVYVRGHPYDYRDWFPDYAEPIRGRGGSMTVEELRWSTDLGDAVLNGARELNQATGNINRDLKTGFMRVQLSMENGKRWSADRLLDEASPGLTIVTHALVTKVLITSKRAEGVEFVRLNRKYRSLARMGVVLSAGTIGTPKILMLSGIGPREHLEDLRINAVNDLPVGDGLVDHILTGLDLVTLNVSLPLSVSSALNPLAALDYFLHGEGPWTSPGIEVVGTFHSGKNESELPDLQLMALPLGLSKDNGVVLKETMGITDKVFQEYFGPLVHENAVTIAPVLLHPRSTGHVRLRSKDPLDHPLIDPRYLSDPQDVQTLVRGLRFVEALVGTRSMRRLGARIHQTKFPGCEDREFASEHYWECYVRHMTLTSYHPAGTCRMGRVVDSKFRVFGTRNLFVADASVLPSLPSGNINGAVAMLAEKAAKVLLQRVNQEANETCSRPKIDRCGLFGVCRLYQRSVQQCE